MLVSYSAFAQRFAPPLGRWISRGEETGSRKAWLLASLPCARAARTQVQAERMGRAAGTRQANASAQVSESKPQGHQRGTSPDAELGPHVLYVAANRRLADSQLLADGTGLQACRKKRNDIALTRGQ